MNTCLNGLTHGPVHILTGGQWANEEKDFVAATGYYMLAPLVTKYLWRKGFLRIPDFCLEGEGCVTSCPSRIYESRGMNVYDVLMEVNALAWMATLTGGILVRGRSRDTGKRGGFSFFSLFFVSYSFFVCSLYLCVFCYLSSLFVFNPVSSFLSRLLYYLTFFVCPFMVFFSFLPPPLVVIVSALFLAVKYSYSSAYVRPDLT